MITTYFDDSGTHTTSEIVIVAGVFATEARTRLLERRWRKLLANPLEGQKPALRRFHMTDCFHSRGEFTGWTRTETDYLCHLFREEMIGAEIAAYAVACSRKDWDELVTGDYTAIFGNAEGFCIRNCFVRTLSWAQRYTFDPDIQFVFDSRTSPVERDAGIVNHAYANILSQFRISNISFENSTDTVLLQAADYIAWEMYNHAKEVIGGINRPPRREEFKRFINQIQFDGQIADRAAIKEMVEKLWDKKDPEIIAAIANHFKNFDPMNPDYSYLAAAVPENRLVNES